VIAVRRESAIDRYPRHLGCERLRVEERGSGKSQVRTFRWSERACIEQPYVKSPRRVVLMQGQEEAVVALRELERHDVVVVARRSRLVAGVCAFAVDENAHAVVGAEEE
jgi:hypothetical protein